MNYISLLANEIRAEVPDDLTPEDSDLLFLLYAVLLLAKGPGVTGKDVHNAWAAWMTHRREHHQALVPFHDLPEGTKAEDDPFVRAIRRVAERRGVPVR